MKTAKTAVSVPIPVFEAAEKAAKKLRLSRSEFYSRAVAAFVDQINKNEITAQLNRVYKHSPSRMDPAIYKMHLSAIDKSDLW